MQDPKALLTILGKMAQKPELKFDNLFSKLYNTELWLMAYQSIAPNPGSMTAGVDGKTIDGASLELINEMILDLKASRYKPKPARRIYIPKPNGKTRPLGIAGFRDKLLQTVVRFIIEAIYEPTFTPTSHGFRPNRSCHTALEEVKKMIGVRWWVEADIKSFYDNMGHDTLLRILSKRITDQRFLHLINQFLRAGYIDNWKYNQTYSGVPQGSPLSPVLSNIYLNELDKAIAKKTAEFNRGRERRENPEYLRVAARKFHAKKKARDNGDWKPYKSLRHQMLNLPATDPLDPEFRRLHYLRYADDVLVGINGSKIDAVMMKTWLEEYLRDELQLELALDKTRITNAKERIRFLGYDVKRWDGKRRLRFPTRNGITTRRTTTFQLILLMPQDKVTNFAKKYGNSNKWKAKMRPHLLNLSELEILMIYNAEIRGFLGYYSLATNLKKVASAVIWLTTGSFMRTVAAKQRSSTKRISKRLKKGPGQYVIKLEKEGKTVKEYALIASTKQLVQGKIMYNKVDQKPNTLIYQSRNELGKRLLAQQCEWCGTRLGAIEVHHVRKLKDLKGKEFWERHMSERQRKTLVLCKECHMELHAGRLSETKRAKKELES